MCAHLMYVMCAHLVARKAASKRLSSVFARRFHSWVVGLALVHVTRILIN
ncbi:hypothetical protein Hanom_Chr05g00411571 [Helianthus anomalus]